MCPRYREFGAARRRMGRGEGVAGGCAAAPVVGADTGAAGGAGVEATLAGVDGSAVLGAGLGLVVMHTMKPFSSILYDSIVLSSCRILPE